MPATTIEEVWGRRRLIAEVDKSVLTGKQKAASPAGRFLRGTIHYWDDE
jgi:hypothetical protein